MLATDATVSGIVVVIDNAEFPRNSPAACITNSRLPHSRALCADRMRMLVRRPVNAPSNRRNRARASELAQERS